MPLIPAKLFGVIGYPLGGTMGPLLYNTAFQALNIQAAHLAWEITPEQVPDFMRSFRLMGIHGFNVTMPHKLAVLPFLDEVLPLAKSVGAVNLIWLEDGKICGDNSDVHGFMAPLKAYPRFNGLRKALIIGAGGASRAVLAGLKALALPEIRMTARSEDKARILAEEFQVQTLPWAERGDYQADLLVNATPNGMRGKAENESSYPAYGFAGKSALAFDCVYNPMETKFLREAKAAGWDTQSGWGMYIAQAEKTFAAWTGQQLPQAAVEAVLAAMPR